MPIFDLSDYLEIVPGCSESMQEGGEGESVQPHSLSLKIPLNQWPEALQAKWKQELFYLFPAEKKKGRMDARDCLVLCHEVVNCRRKPTEEDENRICPHYNQGICIMATTAANDLRPLSFGTIGAFNGISKQRVQQIYCAAQKKVIKAAAADPILREYYISLGMRPEKMPDPSKIAASMEAVIGGS